MCCRETIMPITASEASRLSRRTGLSEEQFCSKDEAGIRRLLNNQETKACVFLATTSALPSAPGICSVYDTRPFGCKTYPVILDEKDLAISSWKKSMRIKPENNESQGWLILSEQGS